MIKNKKILFGLLAVIGVSLSVIASNDAISSEADTIDLSSKVIKYWDDGNGNQVRDPSQSPTYITFKPGTLHYKEHGDKKFWQRLHENQFLVYSVAEPNKTQRNNANMDMYQIRENRVRRPNTDYWKLVDPEWNQNLKLGSIEPGYQSKDMYRGDDTGTTTLTGTKYFGKKYEWRYLGYGSGSQIYPIENPFFPSDYPVDKKEDWRPDLKNWVSEPWLYFTSPSVYDGDLAWSQKVLWFEKYFFKQNSEFRRPEKTLREDAEYWAKRFSLANDPTESTGIVTGWHISNRRVYYASFIMATPPQSNLRLIDLQIKDKETGKVIGQQTMSDSNDADKEKKIAVNQYVEEGKTYTITAKVKNMIVPGLNGKDTKHQPIRLYQAYKVDKDIYSYNYTIPPNENVYPSNQVSTIKYGGTVDFSKEKDGEGNEVQWEFTVPKNAKKEVLFEAGIDYGFYLAGENIYTDDDFAELEFKIKPEDIAIGDAILVDSKGNQVEDVIPNQTYGLRIFVKKFEGNKIVGDQKDPMNPYASVDVEVTDKASVSRSVRGQVAKASLNKKGDVVAIDIPNAITPKASVISAKWIIAQKHRDNGQSQIPTNDGWRSKMWASEVNISVKDFRVKPQAIMRPKGKEAGKENLTFQFQVMNQNREKQTKDISYVIRSQGRDVYKGSVSAPANKPIPVNVSVPNVPLFFGEVPFEVEVNPAPRKWIEFKKDASDPYTDNKANNAVHVYQNQLPIAKCEIVHTQNNWTTTYSLYEWHGHRESYESCKIDKDGNESCRTVYYCVTDWDNSWEETKSHYERYEIKNVFFRSKLTDDTQGGWVDILKQPGKVKAGYGFEIKFVVQYTTNSYSAAPKPWRSGCSGKTVSPGWSSVTTPQSITVTMPYTDQSGQPVVYNLTPTSTSGSWDNKTEVYEMPIRNVFNMKTTREIFVNEGARDAKYNIRIDTFPFYGSYDKPPTTAILCDSRQIVLQILGSYTDDLKSHLTQ